MFNSLITDRTILDFERWRTLRDKGIENMTEAEREEWAGDMKGAYNASDLNRVGEVLNTLRDRLKDAGYLGGNEFVMRTDWLVGEIPTAAAFSAYLGAVATVRGAVTQFPETPETPADTGGLDFEGANAIEKICYEVNTVLRLIKNARYFVNELYCGEVKIDD